MRVLEPAAAQGRDVAVMDNGKTSWCGRFLVGQGSDVVLVDDDCLELWTCNRLGGRPVSRGGTLLDGSEVEVVGLLSRAPAGDLTSVVGGGYRTEPEVLRLDGRPDTPVIVLVTC